MAAFGVFSHWSASRIQELSVQCCCDVTAWSRSRTHFDTKHKVNKQHGGRKPAISELKYQQLLPSSSDLCDFQSYCDKFHDHLSTMYTHYGSQYSSPFDQDEYEFDDENDDYLDDELDNDDPDQSDEDTDDASENDIGKGGEEYTEIKEQMYQDKLASLKKQLQQLKDGTHPEYNKKLKRLDAIHKERLRLNIISHEYLIECVERDFVLEKKAAAKEFEEKKIELRENVINDLEDKRKLIEAERHSMELTGDSMEVKPVMTRKLRRRPNDPVPVPEKRRKPPPAQVNYFLDDKEIEADLKLIARGSGKQFTPIRKPTVIPTASVPLPPPPQEHLLLDSRIEDGKLLYERRWYHRGQTIYVEGKDLPRFAAVISAIGTEAIWVKKSLDCAKVRIYLSQLSRGKITIKRRAS